MKVRNVSNQTIYAQLPTGRVEIAPSEEADIPQEVFEIFKGLLVLAETPAKKKEKDAETRGN